MKYILAISLFCSTLGCYASEEITMTDKLLLIIEQQVQNSHTEKMALIAAYKDLTDKVAEQAKEGCKKKSLREKLFGDKK